MKKIYIMRVGLTLEPLELEVTQEFIDNLKPGGSYATGLPSGELQYFGYKQVRLSKAAAKRKQKSRLNDQLSRLKKQVFRLEMSIRGGGMRYIK